MVALGAPSYALGSIKVFFGINAFFNANTASK